MAILTCNYSCIECWYTNEKLLYCHGVSEGNVDKKISKLEYNNRTVYDCFNNLFTDEFNSLYFNLPPITFDNRPHWHKIAWYPWDILLVVISVVSENPFRTLTTYSDYLDLLPYDDRNTLHVMKMNVPVQFRVCRGYCCKKHDKKKLQKDQVILLHMLW